MGYYDWITSLVERRLMKQINNFSLGKIPSHKIVFVLTSEVDYVMERIIFVEQYPDYAHYTLIRGGHCSCYDFDETYWEATIVEEQELSNLLKGWEKHGYGLEPQMVALIRKYQGGS